jgi:4'-phosphopantetheinyl transferase
MIEVYYANALETAWEECRTELLARLPEARRIEVQRYRNREDVLRGIAAGILLEYGLNRHGLTLNCGEKPFRQTELLYNAQGKPFLPEYENVYFNLSHAGAYAVAAVAEIPVGVDVEEIGRANEKIAERFFKTEEQESLRFYRHQGDEAWQKRFAFLWTRKESYIKAVGEGMRIPLDSFSVLEDSSEEGYFYQTIFVPEGYCISVCSRGGDTVKLVPLELTDIGG